MANVNNHAAEIRQCDCDRCRRGEGGYHFCSISLSFCVVALKKKRKKEPRDANNTVQLCEFWCCCLPTSCARLTCVAGLLLHQSSSQAQREERKEEEEEEKEGATDGGDVESRNDFS